jgi:hypothetical protein
MIKDKKNKKRKIVRKRQEKEAKLQEEKYPKSLVENECNAMGDDGEKNLLGD